MTAEAKAIFRAIRGTDERFGTTMISAIVRGEHNDRIRRAGYDALPVFGALSSYSVQEVKGMIQQFVASGYLQQSMGKYPILSLQAGAEEVLAGHSKVQEIKQEVARPRAKRTGDHSRISMGDSTNSLFEALRLHRKRIALTQKVPPYLVFTDTVLIDLAALKPKTLADFANIKGVGEAKLKKYGTSFLAVIAQYENDSGSV